jgi:hypothetical protein
MKTDPSYTMKRTKELLFYVDKISNHLSIVNSYNSEEEEKILTTQFLNLINQIVNNRYYSSQITLAIVTTFFPL